MDLLFLLRLGFGLCFVVHKSLISIFCSSPPNFVLDLAHHPHPHGRKLVFDYLIPPNWFIGDLHSRYCVMPCVHYNRSAFLAAPVCFSEGTGPIRIRTTAGEIWVRSPGKSENSQKTENFRINKICKGERKEMRRSPLQTESAKSDTLTPPAYSTVSFSRAPQVYTSARASSCTSNR